MADNKAAPKTGLTSPEFYAGLDADVSPAVLDVVNAGNTAKVVPPDDDIKKTPKEKPPEKSDNTEKEALEKELANLQKRYDNSSEEGKRLDAELKKYKEYDPVIQYIAQNEEVQQILADHAEGKKVQLADEDALDDDDPNSKLLKKIDSLEKKISTFEQKTKQERDQEKKEQVWNDFKSKNKMTDAESEEYQGWVKNTKVSHDTLYKLFQLEKNTNGDKDDDNGKLKANQMSVVDVITQLQKAGAIPATIPASEGSAEEKELTVEEKIIHNMKVNRPGLKEMLMNVKK